MHDVCQLVVFQEVVAAQVPPMHEVLS